MKQWKRVGYYLMLNVLISACTTLAVLYAWDQLRSPLPGGLLPQFGAASTVTATDIPQLAANATPAPTPTPLFIAYQVKAGDTFDSIAQAHGVTVEELMAENGFTSKTLGEGEVLRIPVYSEPPAQEGELVIDRVAGIGDLESERVLLRHPGEGEILLVGWQLEDQDGNVFIFPQFPQLTLYKNGAVNVFTRPGTNTVIDLFWGLQQPVWEAGETVTLRDAAGEVRATYTIP